MQDIVFHDIIGTVGVALILLCYFLIQVGKLTAENLSYSIINMIGISRYYMNSTTSAVRD